MLSVLDSTSCQRTENVVEVVPDKAAVGKVFRKDAQPLLEWFSQLDSSGAEELDSRLESDG